MRGNRQIQWDVAVALLVFSLVALVYAPSVGYDYVYLDDLAYVAENPDVTGGLSWGGVQAAFGKMQQGLWIPLLNVSYMLDVALFGLRPWGFHLTNILFHSLNAMLAFVILKQWTGKRSFACWGALVWALHPLRVESVAWISGRKDVMSGLFFLLCVWSYVRSMSGEERARPWFWASVVFLGLGVMAKSTLMATPLLLVGLDGWPLRRMRQEQGKPWMACLRLLAEKWPFWALGLVSGLLSMAGHSARDSIHEIAWLTRLARIPLHVAYYLGETIWPRGLSVLYDDLPLNAGMVLGSVFVVILVTFMVWTTRRRFPAFGAGWLWYIALLLPVTGVVAFGAQSRADRYAYLPALGLVLFAAHLPCPGPRTRRMWYVLGAASVLAFGSLTAAQLPVWQNSGTLFGRVLEVDPDHVRGNVNQGMWLWEQGDEAESMDYFQRAWSQPSDGLADSLGSDACRLVFQGRARLTQAMIRPAVNHPEATAIIHAGYGMACLHLGEWPDAIRHLGHAARLAPAIIDYQVELIRAHFEAGDVDAARQQAARLEDWPGAPIKIPSDLFPYYHQVWRDGARPYAWGFFRRLAEMEPENAVVLNNMAWLAATDPQAPADSAKAAVSLAQQAVDLDGGNDPAILNTLAVALACAGDFEGAVAAGERAHALAEQQDKPELTKRIRRRVEQFRLECSRSK